MRSKHFHNVITRMKITDSKKGVPKSEEHKAKISQARKRQEDQKKREKAQLENLLFISKGKD